ncbi:hypothetical protein HYC85_004093 [Camellia sinensis]|uniref:Uncharacterized protein n=1 Tax=Camellia sinensis TaxID=4442 RepID=A0A7J7HY70_CAMSI|nr:hypothetical protein HYC85_004093 [Camellia sinensis]
MLWYKRKPWNRCQRTNFLSMQKITNYMKKLEKVSAPLFTGLSAFLCVDWDLGMYPAQNCLCCT